MARCNTNYNGGVGYNGSGESSWYIAEPNEVVRPTDYTIITPPSNLHFMYYYLTYSYDGNEPQLPSTLDPQYIFHYGDTYTIPSGSSPNAIFLFYVIWGTYGDIANEILSTIGDDHIPYSSMYDVCLNVYTDLGYTDMVDFEAVYEIINQTYPNLAASQNTGKVYGLNVNKLWVGSSDEYGSLPNHDKNVLYLIPE